MSQKEVHKICELKKQMNKITSPQAIKKIKIFSKFLL